MTSTTKQANQTNQQLLAKAPATKRKQIITILANVRALLANGHSKAAAQQLAYARLIMRTVCNTSIPQAIRHHVAVAAVSIIGTGKAKRYNAYTEAAGFVSAPTAKQWLAKYSEQAKASAMILGGAA